MADPSAFEVESGAPEPARPDLLFRPGDRLGRWQILGLLGRGAQGLVYEARDEATGQLAALKVLREAPEQSAEAELPPGQAGAETLRREAAILAELAHPNLIAARGLEAIEGRAVLVLEPIDGVCLADRLAQAERPIGEEQLFALLLGLAEALQAVHQAGYLHRDIKPGNVYLRADGSPVLIDFSAAGQPGQEPGQEEQSDNSLSLVTSSYAPIEQYQVDGKEGPWTDLYGLAALAYRIVTGRPPPPAPSRLAGEDLPPARDVAKGRYSAVLLAAIDRGLALDPAGRPAAMADWITLLEWAQRQRETEPQPAAPAPTPVPPPPSAEAKPVAAPAPARATGSGLPTAPLDDLPPTEKVTRMPLSLQAEDAPEGVRLRAERRETAREPRRSGVLGFVLTASLLAVLGWGGWEGYLRFVKTEWRVDPSGAGDVLSIAQALARARDGATLLLAPGTYRESVTIARPVVLAGPTEAESPAIIEPVVGPCVLAQADGASLRHLVLRRPAPTADVTGATPAGGPCLDIGSSVRVEDSEVSSAAGPAVLIRDGADPALTRVTVARAEGAGLLVEGGARGSFTEGAIRGTSKAGILVRSGARPTVSDSLIEETAQAGILITGGGQGLFQGNEVRAAGASAIEIRGGADPALRGNSLSGAKEAGLYVHDGGAGRFSKNQISGNGFSGVVIGPGGAPALSGNEVSGNGEHGVAILAGGGGRIEGNRILDNKGHGIVRSSESAAEILDNALSGNREPQSRTARIEGQ